MDRRGLASLALAGTVGVVAAEQGMSTQTLINIITLALILGTWFFWYTAVTAERSFFLVLGCFCCCLGDMFFGVMIIEEQGNMTWGALFLCLVLPAAHGLYAQFIKYRREGIFTDSEEEEGGEAPDIAPPTVGGRPLPRLLAAQAQVAEAAKRAKKTK